MNELSITQIYDSKTTIDHVKALAFNRSSGSTGETEAVLYIQQQLKSAQIRTKFQYFTVVGPFIILLRIIYVILFAYLLVYRLLLVLAIYFGVKYLFAKTRNFSLVKKEDSKNLIATISANENRKKGPVVILTAHYDSFSANIPNWLQKILFFIFRVIIIPYSIITIAFSIWLIRRPPLISEQEVENLVIISSLVEFVIVFMIFLLIYNTSKSKGSIDNASGVAILIELTKLLKNNPLDNFDVITVFTGAEEWGLIGSKKFCKKYRKILSEKYDLDESFNINIDMMGTYIGLVERKRIFRKKHPLNAVINETAKELNIPILIHHKLFAPKTDHRNFKRFAKRTKSKFQVACFHSEYDSKYIHSRQDTPDKCSSEILNNGLILIFNALKKINSQIKTNE